MLKRIKDSLNNWMIMPSSGVHLDAADGFRGLAIVMVVLAHGLYSNPNGPKIFNLLNHIARMGTLGVPVFFVLSGFLLSLPFFRGREQEASFWYHDGFAARRVLKIIPPFYLVIVVLVILYYCLYHDPVYFKLGLAWATGFAHFVWFEKELNGSFWSLWVEIGFYAILPFLFLAVPGKNVRRLGWALFLVLLAVSCVSRWLLWHGPSEEPGKWFFFTSRFPSSLDFFAWGVLFAAFYLSRSGAPEGNRPLGRFGYLGLALLLVSAMVILRFELKAGPDWAPGRWEVEARHFLPGLSSFFLLFLVFDPGSLACRFFSSSIMRFLGIVSYEWFLIHQPIQGLTREWAGSAHGSLLRYFCIVTFPMLFSLALATLIYYKFSLPIMKWGRNRLKQSRGAKTERLPIQQGSTR